jgi:hypothetical protein
MLVDSPMNVDASEGCTASTDFSDDLVMISNHIHPNGWLTSGKAVTCTNTQGTQPQAQGSVEA